MNKEIYITVQKSLYESSLKNEKMFRAIFDHAPVGISIGVPGKCFLRINKKMSEILGYSQVELLNKGLLDIVCSEDRQACQTAVERLWQEEEQSAVLEKRWIKKDKSVIWVKVFFTMQRDEAGAVQLLIMVVEDISEKKLAEESLEEQMWGMKKTDEAIKVLYQELTAAKKQAEAASKAKSDFLANMSHELRTPLNAVIGFAEILTDESYGPVNDKQREFLNDIGQSGKHLLSLINDILDLAKVEAGKIELELGRFELKPALENSLSMIKEKVLKHGIMLVKEIEDIGIIEADERKFKQIMFNLLSNAAKFTPDGGRIRVKGQVARASGARGVECVEVSVRDTGIGIEEKDREKVFAEFEQIDTAKRRKYAGTGLGMPLTKKLVELHGGRIWFESAGKDKGTTFYFTLPLKQPAKINNP